MIKTSTFRPDDNQYQKILNKINSENRDSKLESLLNGKEYIEKKVEDDKEYQNLWKILF